MFIITKKDQGGCTCQSFYSEVDFNNAEIEDNQIKVTEIPNSSPDFWNIENGEIVELHEAAQAAEINNKISHLYSEALKFQRGVHGIDPNMDRELTVAMQLLANGATAEDLPNAAICQEWLTVKLWGPKDSGTGWYYKGKAAILAGEDYTDDIAEVVGPIGVSFHDLMADREYYQNK